MGFKLVVVLILTVVFFYELFLHWLRQRSKNHPIPPCVRDVYDEETYRTRLSYSVEKNRLGMLQSTAVFVVSLALLLFNVYAAFTKLFPANEWVQMFAVLLLSTIAALAKVPFVYYDTMVIEQKYGFNRTTKGTFFLDRIKELFISLLFMIALGSLLYAAHKSFGDWLILVFAAVATLFILFIAFIFPWISRLFNKFKPLENSELKEKLTALLEKNGYHVRAIQVMDGSRRSSKANAYFAGFGKMKTIVLYDTLVEAMTTDEIVAVFAHELGHGLHKDTLKLQFVSFLQMLALGFLAWLALRTPSLFAAFGFSEVNYGFALLLIEDVGFGLIAPLFGLFSNWLTRRAEYRADAQAAKEGYGDALISALKKLARQNFSDLAPAPMLVRLTYSHPTLSQRIEAIRALETKPE